MITSDDITRQVEASLTDWVSDFDVPAIVADIIATYGLVDIDDIDTEEYWALVQTHDVTEE